MLMLASLVVLARQDAIVLPRVFSDRMVLQRERPVPVWGTATAGSTVTVRLGNQTKRTRATANGKWTVRLDAMPASGPFELSVNGTVRAKDIMVGEVWIASGQSNMEWPVIASSDYPREAREADRRVRMFTAAKISAETPQFDVPGSWDVANNQTVGAFSAVGYSFARNVAERLNITVGVIHTSWGGTPAESWTSRPALRRNPELSIFMDRYKKVLDDFPVQKAVYDRVYGEWRRKVYLEDTGNQGALDGWQTSLFNDGDWGAISLPNLVGPGPDGKPYNGATWFRRVVDIPEGWAGSAAVLELGPIDDFDDTYVNGNKVGEMGRAQGETWREPRIYRVSSGILRPGRNVVAIRVFDWFGGAGFRSPGGTMKIRRAGSEESISLEGEWKTKIERAVDEPSEELLRQEPPRPFGPGNPWVPGGLYNGMIAPFVPYGIRGAIWYQGESNADRAIQYRTLFPAMIADWRQAFGQGDFPFYFVQLANFMKRDENPGESAWAELREAQSLTEKRVRNTGQAVIIDIGEADDIHPRNKRDVGARLAGLALTKTYGIRVPFTGPTYRFARREATRMRVFFDNVGQGLKTTDGRAPVGFSIAGADGKFVWAEATISGPCVLVSSPLVLDPVAVRYGWANNPDVNLTNQTGLPASPFRTDSFPAITARNR